MREVVIKTKRLDLRIIEQSDYDEIKNILQDSEVMYAWEKAFSDEEVNEWINKNLSRYKTDGYSYYLAIDREINKIIGVMGPLVERINGEEFIGVAYIINKKAWGKGYAIESVKACIDFAFNVLGANEVIAQIRTNNLASIKVANRLNMKFKDKYIRVYDNKKMEHIIYSIKR